MTKKIIILILAIPLLLMISLFGATNNVTLAVDVSVSGIEINGLDVIYLNLDNNETYKLDYTVYPINASNKDISLSYESIGNENIATFSYDDTNNILKPLSGGITKVIVTTNDGGFSDSFIVSVESTKLVSISSNISKYTLKVGNSEYINTIFNPSTTKDKMLVYSSSNDNVISINDNGLLTAVGKGSATIKVSSYNDESIYSSFLCEVINEDVIDIAEDEISSYLTSGCVHISIDTFSSYNISYSVYDIYNNLLDNNILNINIGEENNGNIIVDYEFSDESFIGSVCVCFTIDIDGIRYSKNVTLTKVNELKVEFDYSDTPVFKVGEQTFINYDINPSDILYSYSVSSINNNISVSMISNKIYFKALKEGISRIDFTVTSQEDSSLTKTCSIDVIVAPSSIIINESANSYGIENIWTIGANNLCDTYEKFSLNVSFNSNSSLNKDSEYIGFVSNNDKVSIDSDGYITILDKNINEVVEFRCVFTYNDIVYASSEAISIRCIGNGYNVYNYLELLEVVNNNDIVVLHSSIKDDFGYNENGSIVYNTMTTTYDYDYYKNIGKEDNATIKVLLNIKNDIYGNGYEINADNICYGLDSNGQLKNDALFRGPLNFVAISDSASSAVSVKGQDNVAFAIYENVTLNNVSLKSCDLRSDSLGQYDLVDLTYTGTTVEIFGDNVNITYSRITNGRTTLRVFGDYLDSFKEINLDISNCVISSAREFLVRMGSNAFVQGSVDNASPCIDDNTSISFPTYNYYHSLSDEFKSLYDSSYIKTYVNIKDSILKESGLFSIAIDSHFSGELLANAANAEIFSKLGIDPYGWYDLAKTSYGAKLTFSGDVRMYDWKTLDSIDSSSLIEVNAEAGTTLAKMSFNISEMVKNASKTEQYKNIVYDYNGTDYVHTGICFFGGGKNYGVFEMDDYDFYSLNPYKVKLSDVGHATLEMAAGSTPFYFLLHDATSTYFLPQKQEEILASGNAYDCIYPKK